MSAVDEQAIVNASFAAQVALGTNGPRRVDLAERRSRRYVVISVDDHLVEPPHMFDGRLPARFAERSPRVIEMDGGQQAWLLDGQLLTQIGINAVVGQDRSALMVEPTRFDQMREGAFDIAARITDMDADGVYASMCFPSLVGFAGVRLQAFPDQDYGLAVLRAWNDWHLEEWAGTYPGRMIPCQIPWLNDPQIAAEEIRQNADRGFRAVTFPELPGKLGLPPLAARSWDPFWAACEETDTVLCIHTGSSGLPTMTEGSLSSVGALFGAGYAMLAAIEWLYARIPLRHPDLKICLSEGGIGWIPALLDRLDHSEGYREWDRPGDDTMSPSEVFQRNFWFCTLNDPSVMPIRDRIGIDRITFEVDYPHADSSWPDTQSRLGTLIDTLPTDDAERIAWRNAAELFRHPVPADVQANPNAF